MNRILTTIICTAIVAAITSFTVVSNNDLNATVTNQNEPVVGLNLGNLAPEIEHQDPSGKIIKLSSLRGKVVLIDFWASWCGPCRFENPNVVKAYETYKDKKFTAGNGLAIYSVSLDVKKENWVSAIQKDNLSWSHHVSDLLGWSSQAAALYGVNSIPTNFLLNEKGIIINKNLKGVELLNALEKLTKK